MPFARVVEDESNRTCPLFRSGTVKGPKNAEIQCSAIEGAYKVYVATYARKKPSEITSDGEDFNMKHYLTNFMQMNQGVYDFQELCSRTVENKAWFRAFYKDSVQRPIQWSDTMRTSKECSKNTWADMVETQKRNNCLITFDSASEQVPTGGSGAGHKQPDPPRSAQRGHKQSAQAQYEPPEVYENLKKPFRVFVHVETNTYYYKTPDDEDEIFAQQNLVGMHEVIQNICEKDGNGIEIDRMKDFFMTRSEGRAMFNGTLVSLQPNFPVRINGISELKHRRISKPLVSLRLECTKATFAEFEMEEDDGANAAWKQRKSKEYQIYKKSMEVFMNLKEEDPIFLEIQSQKELKNAIAMIAEFGGKLETLFTKQMNTATILSKMNGIKVFIELIQAKAHATELINADTTVMNACNYFKKHAGKQVTEEDFVKIMRLFQDCTRTNLQVDECVTRRKELMDLAATYLQDSKMLSACIIAGKEPSEQFAEFSALFEPLEALCAALKQMRDLQTQKEKELDTIPEVEDILNEVRETVITEGDKEQKEYLMICSDKVMLHSILGDQEEEVIKSFDALAPGKRDRAKEKYNAYKALFHQKLSSKLENVDKKKTLVSTLETLWKNAKGQNHKKYSGYTTRPTFLGDESSLTKQMTKHIYSSVTMANQDPRKYVFHGLTAHDVNESVRTAAGNISDCYPYVKDVDKTSVLRTCTFFLMKDFGQIAKKPDDFFEKMGWAKEEFMLTPITETEIVVDLSNESHKHDPAPLNPISHESTPGGWRDITPPLAVPSFAAPGPMSPPSTVSAVPGEPAPQPTAILDSTSNTETNSARTDMNAPPLLTSNDMQITPTNDNKTLDQTGESSALTKRTRAEMEGNHNEEVPDSQDENENGVGTTIPLPRPQSSIPVVMPNNAQAGPENKRTLRSARRKQP